MLDKFRDALKNKDATFNTPKHIAFTLGGISLWVKRNKATLEEAYKRSGKILMDIIWEQTRTNIPVLTFYVLPEDMDKDSEAFVKLLDAIVQFFNDIANDELIIKNRIKVSVLGKWYSLPGRVVDSIKKAIDATKDYDSFFVNFCINYSGQEEIADACRLIARQVKAGKIDPDSITRDYIKENIYSSYFLPPDIIVISGAKKSTSSLLLWDSSDAMLCLADKPWPDFNRADFISCIRQFKK